MSIEYGRCSYQIHRAGTKTPVSLSLHVRRFSCSHTACPRTTFAEPIPEVVEPFARRTVRLADEYRHLVLDLGGEIATRIAQRQGMHVSPDTLLRIARRHLPEQRPTPRILGVDDFALRKGQVYGTLLVDLQRHQPVALLADRSVESLERWLRDHPGVEIISRDRAGAYADGASRGTPDAIQVADRFHLLQNLREVLQRLLERHPAELRAAAIQSLEPLPPPTQPDQTDLQSHSGVTEEKTLVLPVDRDARVSSETLSSERHTATERWQHERHQRRMERYREVQALRAQGGLCQN